MKRKTHPTKSRKSVKSTTKKRVSKKKAQRIRDIVQSLQTYKAHDSTSN